jgi:hypothetical protein
MWFRAMWHVTSQKNGASALGLQRVLGLQGTRQGGVAYSYYLPYYLDECTFCLNRRKSKSRGKHFFRLVQQAVNTPPKTCDSMLKSVSGRPQPVEASRVKGNWIEVRLRLKGRDNSRSTGSPVCPFRATRLGLALS